MYIIRDQNKNYSFEWVSLRKAKHALKDNLHTISQNISYLLICKVSNWVESIHGMYKLESNIF